MCPRPVGDVFRFIIKTKLLKVCLLAGRTKSPLAAKAQLFLKPLHLGIYSGKLLLLDHDMIICRAINSFVFNYLGRTCSIIHSTTVHDYG